MARRQDGKLHTSAGEKRIAADKMSVVPFPDDRCESYIDLLAGAGIGFLSRWREQPHPHLAPCFRCSQHWLD
jgi:hypothetical protein